MIPPHAFKKLQMVFLSLHAFEVVSNILEKVCSKALKHSLQFSVVVKLNFSQPRDVVLIKSTNLESWNNWSFCSVKITKKNYTLTSSNYTTNSAHNFFNSLVYYYYTNKCLHSAYLYLVFNSKPDCCDVVNFVVSTYCFGVFTFVVPQI